MRLAILVLTLALVASPSLAQQPAAAGDSAVGLLDAVRIGRGNAVNAIEARNSAAAASARIGQRRADLLPTINAGASFTRQTLNLDEFGLSFPGVPPVTPDFSVYRLGITARQALWDPAAIARLRAARDNAVAAGLDSRTTADLSGAMAALAYLRVLGADETVRARLEDSTVAASLMQQARRLVDAGVSPAIDATRSEVSFADVRTQLEVARNTAGRSRLDLLRALDFPAGTTLRLTDSLQSLQQYALPFPTGTDSAVSYAMAHRAEIAAERARTESQRRTLTSIKAENLPSVALSGGYTESGRQTSTLRATYNVMLGVSIPILDGFHRQTRAQEQEALVGVQESREHDVQRQVETEVRQAMLDVASATQQTAIAADRVNLAETELHQAQQRFEQGVAGSVETTQAQSAVIAARDAWIQARLAYATARLAAYRALGVLDQIH
ncbi:MAG TPA: TolC family protein [Gemmatimonadales bacterium]